MSTHPSLEARLSAQERRQIILDARIEDLSEDMTESYKHLSAYLGRIEDHNQQIETEITSIKTDIVNMQADIIDMKADIANMKVDITDIKTDITDMKTRIGRVETLLIQVLERLPKAP